MKSHCEVATAYPRMETGVAADQRDGECNEAPNLLDYLKRFQMMLMMLMMMTKRQRLMVMMRIEVPKQAVKTIVESAMMTPEGPAWCASEKHMSRRPVCHDSEQKDELAK